jgi:hypothetical protein
MISRSVFLAVSISAWFTSSAFGQVTTQFTFVNDALGQFIMPYTGTTYSGESQSVPVLCDDFSDEVNFNESWTAFMTDLKAIPDTPNTVYYNYSITNSAYTGTHHGAFTEQENYIAVADLAIQISSLNPLGGQQSSDLSDALWNVFQPGSVTLDAAAQSELNAALDTAVSYVNSDGSSAGQDYETATGKDVTVYSAVYTNPSTGAKSVYTTGQDGPFAGGPGGSRPQEFLTVTSMPEPSSWAVLGLDCVGLGFVGLYFRRRKSRI